MPIQKKKYILTFDTECPGLKNPVYDIGWNIHDKNGNIVESYHALVREVFTDGDQMVRAYFAKKLFSDYAPMLDAQDIRLRSWLEIVAVMREHSELYGVDVIAAYNLGFDQRAMRLTNKLYGDGNIFTRPVQLLDIWQYACETILQSAAYKKAALANGWVSDAGNIKTSAEMAYRFVSQNLGFEEEHTALSDAIIETEILSRCYATKKKIPYGIVNAQPWRLVNAAN